MAADGSIIIDTRIDTAGFQRGTANMEKTFTGLGKTVKKLGAAIGAAFAVKQIVDFGKEAISLGSDLQEVQNVVDSVFTTMSTAVNEFARSAAQSAGLSETMAKKYVGTFGAMAKSFGFAESEALNMSTALTQLTGDVASFYNLSQDEAYTKLKSVFTGETESLKDLGVVMTQSALDAYAMANGFGKTTAAMTEQEKVALRYQFVMSQLSTASGDFLRTSDGWANQVRVLKLQIESLKATIGAGLINLFTPIIQVINVLLAKLATVANAFKAFTELITGKKSSGSTGSSQAGISDTGIAYSDAAAGAKDYADATDKVAQATKNAKKEQDKYLSGLDEINKIQSSIEYETPSTSGGTSGTGGSVNIGGTAAVMNVDYGNIAEGETVIDELAAKFHNLFLMLQTSVQPTVNSLKRLWSEGLSALGTFTWNNLRGFYDYFLVPVARWTLGTGIPRLIDSLNNGLMSIKWSRITSAFNELWRVLAPFAKKIGEGLLWFWENVLVPLGTWTMNEAVPRFLRLLSNAISIVSIAVEILQPLGEWLWNNLLVPLADWTGDTFLKALDFINEKLSKFSAWISENQGLVETFVVIIGSLAIAWGLVNGAVKIWNEVGLIASAISGGLQIAIGFLTSPMGLVVIAIGALIAAGVLLYKNWDKIKEAAGKLKDWLIEKTRNMYEDVTLFFDKMRTKILNIVKAIKTWLKEKWEDIKTTAVEIWDKIKNYVVEKVRALREGAILLISNMKNSLKTIWDGIKTTAVDLWDGIKEKVLDFAESIKEGVVTAFEGMKNTIKSIFETLVTILKQPINAAISLINGFIFLVNKLINKLNDALSFEIGFDLPSWLGGGSYKYRHTMDIPNVNPIPYLATGAVIPPNAPFLAMLGDQKNGTNIEAPLDTIKQALAEVLGSSGGGQYRFTAQINRRTLFDEFITEAKMRQMQTGRNPFDFV